MQKPPIAKKLLALTDSIDGSRQSKITVMPPNQRIKPTPLSRRITSGAPRKLHGWFSRDSVPTRGAAYARPLARCMLIVYCCNRKGEVKILGLTQDGRLLRRERMLR